MTPTREQLASIEAFQEQMRNLRLAATIAEHRDRPDRHDIAETCRWAASRLTHYRDQELAARLAAPPPEPQAMPPIEVGDWVCLWTAYGWSLVLMTNRKLRRATGHKRPEGWREDVFEIRKANGTVWTREPRR